MKSGYKIVRKLSKYSVRRLCIAENWYTCGDVDDYNHMLAMVDVENEEEDR